MLSRNLVARFSGTPFPSNSLRTGTYSARDVRVSPPARFQVHILLPNQSRAWRWDATFRSPAPRCALRRHSVAGSMLPAYLFAPFHKLRDARSIQRLHVPDSFRVSATDRHLQTRCTIWLMKLPCRHRRSLPFRSAEGFPPLASFRLVELSQSPAPASSPWYSARSSFPPRRPLLIGMAPGSSFQNRYCATRLAVPSNLLEPTTSCA